MTRNVLLLSMLTSGLLLQGCLLIDDFGRFREIDASDGGGMSCSPDLAPPENGSVTPTAGTVGDRVIYSCDSGYVLTGNESSNARTCQADGTWSGSAPVCEAIVDPCTPNPCLHGGTCALVADGFECDCGGTGYAGERCERLRCDEELVDPENGSVDRAIGAEGDVATYDCQPGYAIQGSTSRTCEVAGWSGEAPTCAPEPCTGILNPPPGGTADRSTGVTGDIATYACNDGCLLEGNVRRICQADGSWSGETPLCSTWCWSLPTPQGNDLYGVWAANEGEFWVVGESGTLMRGDGEAWTLVESGTRETLRAISGHAPDNAWAVGTAGTILRWNGLEWTAATSGVTVDLHGVHASSDTEVWAVGVDGTILRWNGTTWGAVSTGEFPTLHAVWGASPDEVWAVGEEQTILRWNGSEWSDASPGSGPSLEAVWGAGADAVWVVGGGTILRWDGTEWLDESFAGSGSLRGVWGRSATEVWAVAAGAGGRPLTHRWDGSTWEPMGMDPEFRWQPRAIGGGADQVLVFGFVGSTARFHSGGWALVSSANFAADEDIFFAIAGQAMDGPVWASGAFGLTAYFDGSEWNNISDPDEWTFDALWADPDATADPQLWGAGLSQVLGWSAGAWNTTYPLGNDWSLYGIARAPSVGETWVVGHDGSGRGVSAVRSDLEGVWQEVIPSTEEWLWGVWATDAGQFWAVGNGGRILEFTASQNWSVVPSGSTASLRAVWGSGPSHILAVGSGGTILRWDGSSWQAATSPTTRLLRGVWTSGPSLARAVGDGGTIVSHNGSEWTLEVSPTRRSLEATWGPWAVGQGGTILRRYNR